MRSYRIVRVIDSLHVNYILYLYEAGIEELPIVFGSWDQAYDIAMKYVAREVFILETVVDIDE